LPSTANNMKFRIIALFVSVLMVGFGGRFGSPSVSKPQWRALPTEPYPKKRDDIVFADTLTGFYGTGKGKLYRTQDGGQSWHLIWSKPGTFIRSLGFIDAQHGFLGNLGAGLASITDTTPLYETKDSGMTWEPAQIGNASIPGFVR
jgi:photosystem II stability/assembly factor-like uncharacterized protein